MGFFGVRRAPSKDHDKAEKLLSPSKASSALLAKLFSDSQDDNNNAFKPSFISPRRKATPTITMEDCGNNGKTAADTSSGSIPSMQRISGEDRTIQRKAPTRSAAKSGDSSTKNANSATRTAQRDSIKRSLSRKLARSESRRQMLNLKDERPTAVTGMGAGAERGRATSSNGNTPTEEQRAKLNDSSAGKVIEIKMARMSMSPVTPGLISTLEEGLNTTEVVQEDPLMIEQDDGADLPADTSLAITFDAATLSLPVLEESAAASPSTDSKKSRTKRRPPPLIGAEAGPDSTLDWPSGGLFGSDGGFMTGGFRITAEGMVGKPDVATRQDSDPEADADAPLNEGEEIVVRGLKELRAGPTIGVGAAGRVYIAEHTPTSATMAMKVVNVYNKEKRNQLMKELETLSTHVSRYLVRFHGAFYDGSGAVHIALEYMDHGCLSTFVQRVGSVPEKIVQMIAQDCLRGLRFLHRHHVLHRDFKTANILLSRKLCCAKLSDFGLARDLNPGVSKVDTFVGTVAYMSPERLQGSKYTYASDVWALGLSVVECLLGHHPFNQTQNYFDYIEATAASSTLHGFDTKEKRFSAELRDFVTLCTFTDPKQRPKVAELLEHPWMKGVRHDREIFGSWLDECRTLSIQVSSK